MAHELTETANGHEFAYVGQSPWHGLGTRLPAAATSADIIRAAGLEWRVVSEPIFLAAPGGLEGQMDQQPGPATGGARLGEAVAGYVANVRSDTREVLGVVSEDYRTYQNGDAFAFMDSLVGEAAAMYHTAGSIRRGRKVFASAKLPDTLVVGPGDAVEQYLLLVNNHDGDGGLHFRFTPIRVVCANTLSAALDRGTVHSHSIRHVGDLAGRVQEARAALGLAARYFEVAGEIYRVLSAKRINALMLDTFLGGFVPVPHVDVDSTEAAIRERDRALATHARIRELYETGLGTDLPGVKGTAWGAFNAGVEWLERVRTSKKDGTFRAGAAEAVVFGVGQEYRQRAMDAALALLKA